MPMRSLASLCLVLSLSACQIGRFKTGVANTAVITEVKMPKQMTVTRPIKGSDLLLIGLAGAALGATVPYSPSGAYSMGAAFGEMDSSRSGGTTRHDPLQEFFRAELQRQIQDQLTATGLLRVIDRGAADSQMKVRVHSWGFTKPVGFMPNVFSNKVKAACDISVEVKTKDGKRVWNAAVFGTGPLSYTSQLKGYTLEELEARPQLQKQELTSTARLAAESLAKTMIREAGLNQPSPKSGD
jgi:hypothetical protein